MWQRVASVRDEHRRCQRCRLVVLTQRLHEVVSQHLLSAHVERMTTSTPRRRPSVKATDELCNCGETARFEELFTSADLAEYLGVPLRTVQDWRSAGTGPRGVRLGKYVRFRASDVAQWLEDRLEAA